MITCSFFKYSAYLSLLCFFFIEKYTIFYLYMCYCTSVCLCMCVQGGGVCQFVCGGVRS